MKEEYKALCSESNPVKGELFGEQLSQSVKDLNETNKVTSRLTKKKSPPHAYFLPFFVRGVTGTDSSLGTATTADLSTEQKPDTNEEVEPEVSVNVLDIPLRQARLRII